MKKVISLSCACTANGNDAAMANTTDRRFIELSSCHDGMLTDGESSVRKSDKKGATARGPSRHRDRFVIRPRDSALPLGLRCAAGLEFRLVPDLLLFLARRLVVVAGQQHVERRQHEQGEDGADAESGGNGQADVKTADGT